MKPMSVLLVALVSVAVIAVIALKPDRSQRVSESVHRDDSMPSTGSATTPASEVAVTKPAALPRLLDLGAKTCIPCKLMTPILEDLKAAYIGVIQVDVIDVWEDKAAAQTMGISSIPTQIFFAPDGKELFRHEGFLAKEDILEQWRKLGYDLKPAVPAVGRDEHDVTDAVNGPASTDGATSKRSGSDSTP
jgi:thioredoxin 1